MIILDGNFAERLIRRVDEEKVRRSGHILAGTASSLEDYKSRCEALRVLDLVIEWIEQIQSDINRGD